MGKLFSGSCFVLIMVLSSSNSFAQDASEKEQEQDSVVTEKSVDTSTGSDVQSDVVEGDNPQSDPVAQKSADSATKPGADKSTDVKSGGSPPQEQVKVPDAAAPDQADEASEVDAASVVADKKELVCKAPDHSACKSSQVQDMDLSLQSIWINEMVRKDWIANVSCDQLTELKNVIYVRHGYFFDNESQRTQYQDKYSVYVPNANVHDGTINFLLTSSDRFSLLRIAMARRTCK